VDISYHIKWRQFSKHRHCNDRTKQATTADVKATAGVKFVTTTTKMVMTSWENAVKGPAQAQPSHPR
ncbi:MAG TPA: hypothetical protein VIN58_00005, partial [Roseateles sp.]